MTKNITAVLIALLLSAAAFAKPPQYEHEQQRPQPGSAFYTSPFMEEILKETEAIANAFHPYNQAASLPEQVKTRATLKYVITDNILAWDGEGRIHKKGSVISYNIPAVFLPSQDKNSHLVAVPAQRLQQINGETFEMSYSIVSISKTPDSIRLSNKFVRSENGCPAGMALRRAKNEQEADICLFLSPSRGLKEKFQAVFSNNHVTQAMAAKALK